MDILELISSKSGEMTPKQRSIAHFIMESPEEVSYLSLKELSRRAGASEVSVLRFCEALGFSGYTGLKEALGAHTKSAFKSGGRGFMMSRENRLSGSREDKLRQICFDERMNLNAMTGALDADRLFTAAQDIIRSRRVLIFAHDRSCLFAEYLRSRLSFLHIEAAAVHLGDSDSLPAVLAGLGENDCMLLFSFLPYHMPIKNIAEYGRYRNLPIISITDSYESPAAIPEANVFICPTGTRYYFNSQVATASFINILASCIAMELGDGFDEILANEQKVTDFLLSSSEGKNGEKNRDSR